MTINPASTIQTSLSSLQANQSINASMLKNSLEQPRELMDKLIQVNVQQTIDAGKMETIGQIIDMIV